MRVCEGDCLGSEGVTVLGVCLEGLGDDCLLVERLEGSGGDGLGNEGLGDEDVRSEGEP